MFHEELARQKVATEAETEKENKNKKSGKGKKNKKGLKGVRVGDNGLGEVTEPPRSERDVESSATPAATSAATSAAPVVIAMDRTGWPGWLSTAVDNLVASTSDILDTNLRDLIVKLPIFDAKLGFMSGTVGFPCH
jgi:hypothetical protein